MIKSYQTHYAAITKDYKEGRVTIIGYQKITDRMVLDFMTEVNSLQIDKVA